MRKERCSSFGWLRCSCSRTDCSALTNCGSSSIPEARLSAVRACSAFGKDAYPDLDARAAALLHSIARNHALIDGDKRLGLAAVIAFCGLNGRRLTLTNDEAYLLVVSVAAGQLDNVDDIAAVLQRATQPRR
jgi:death on curing protein